MVTLGSFPGVVIFYISSVLVTSMNRTEAFQLFSCRIVQLNQSRGSVFLQVCELRSSWNREHDRRFPKQPRQRDLRRLCLEALRCAGQRTVMFRELAGGEWEKWDEADVFPGAILQHVLGVSIDQIISVLHRNDWGDAPNRLDLVYVDFRQPNIADLALALKIDQRTDLIFHRDFRVDPVQL